MTTLHLWFLWFWHLTFVLAVVAFIIDAVHGRDIGAEWVAVLISVLGAQITASQRPAS